MNTTQHRIAKSTSRPDQRFVDVVKPTISFRIAPSLLARIDRFGKERGQKRSNLIEEALEFFLRFHSISDASNDRGEESAA